MGAPLVTVKSVYKLDFFEEPRLPLICRKENCAVSIEGSNIPMVTPPVTSKSDFFEDPLLPRIWRKENYTVSIEGGNIPVVDAPKPINTDELADTDSLEGPRVRIKVPAGITLGGVFRYQPNNSTESRGVGFTDTRFNMVLDYWHLNKFIKVLEDEFGLKVPELSGVRGWTRERVINVDMVRECNAWCNLLTGDITLGVCNHGNGINLSSDLDILFHEFGHFLLNLLAPGILGIGNVFSASGNLVGVAAPYMNAMAIHEGFADMTSALRHQNSAIGEDTYVFTGKPPARGLRNVEDDVHMSATTEEPHDRGRVYGGFFWGLKSFLERARPSDLEKVMPSDLDVYKLMMKFLLEFARALNAYLHPTPKDFVDAVLYAAESIAMSEFAPIDLNNLREYILDDAVRREIIDDEFRSSRLHSAIPEPASVISVLRNIIDVEDISTIGGLLYGHIMNGMIFPKRAIVVGTAVGESAYYPQYFRCKHGDVEVLGGGIHVETRETPYKEFEHLSGTRLIMKVREIEIDEEITVSVQAARIRVREKLEEKMRTLYGIDGSVIDYTGLADAIMLLHTIPEPELVVLPSMDNIAYRFRLGDITAFVDGQSGDILLSRNYITR